MPTGSSKEPEIDITGLQPGDKYELCVTAVNDEGESDPLCTVVQVPGEDTCNTCCLNMYLCMQKKI